MKKMILLFFCLLTMNLSYAQQNDSLRVVTLNSGDIRIGKILSDDGREILLETSDIGKIYIRKENIKSITPYQMDDYKLVQGEFRGAGPFTTRYCFTTNALAIKRGENYAMVNLYGPEVHFALSNRFSLGVMASWIASPMVLAAKYTIPTKNEKWNFGLGTLAGTSGYLNTFRGFGGLHWAMMTFGNRMNNITLSAGFSYIRSGIQKTYDNLTSGIYVGPDHYPVSQGIVKIINPVGTAPVIGLGGIAKVGKKASFIFDAMFFFGTQSKKVFKQEINFTSDPATGSSIMIVQQGYYETSTKRTSVAFFMPAMRFQTKDNTAFQVALAGALYNDGSEAKAFPVPMVSWFFKF